MKKEYTALEVANRLKVPFNIENQRGLLIIKLNDSENIYAHKFVLHNKNLKQRILNFKAQQIQNSK